uniref:Undecaprenyl-phosphate galactose phosphotransferase n=1 Tax=Mycobacterium sp. (strain JLS) TaxID=164757 RepID=A0A5Q5CIU6_MYCSJ
MPPSSQATVPRQAAVAASVSGGATARRRPRFLDRLRAESGYIAITIALDVWAGAWAVVLAHLWIGDQADNRNVLLYSWAFVPVLVLVLATRSLYKRKLNRSFLDELEPVETAAAVSALAVLSVMVLRIPALPEGQQVVAHIRPSDVMVRIWLCAAILVPAVRLMRSVTQRYLRRKHRFGAPALIVGSGPITNQIITRMAQVPDYGLRPVGVLDDAPPTDAELVNVPYLGTVDNFENAVRATGAEDLIIAPSPVSGEQLARCAQLAQRLGVRVRVVPRLMDVVNGNTRIEHLGGVPLMVLSPVDPKGWQFAFKYALGRTIAALGVLLISPLFIGLALAVKLSSPGPIFFRQPRVGRDGVVFDCLKFRSMRPAPAGATFELKAGAAPGGVEGEDRRTRIGKFMRKTSLDELPQLLNVVKGDMTLVGPRPERPEFVELFEMHVRRYGERHRVKAGITGWSQVHGLRGQTSIADRAEFDNYYIENWSLLLDFKILILTVLAVLRPTEE